MSFSNEQVVGLIRKNPISVSCGVLTVALLGALYFRKDLQAEAQVQLEQNTTEAERLAANLKNSAQLKEQVDALLASEKEVDARMIRAGQLTTNRQYFYKLESELGVKLLDLRQSSGAKKEVKAGYVPTSFALNVQGEYNQLLTFLRRLESGPHYCRVLTASTSAPPERKGPMVLTLNLELLGLP